MNARWPLVLRAIAIAIAVAALIDPVLTTGVTQRPELIAIDLTSAGSDRVAASLEAAATRWQIVRRAATGARLPCGPHERCVMIADGSVDALVPADSGPLSMIAIREAGAPNIAVRSVIASGGHVAAAGSIRVELAKAGAIGQTEIRISDSGAIVGSITHVWTSDIATVDVPWWPVGTGVRALRVEAVPAAGETSIIDNAIDVGVPVTGGRVRVLVFDARPSWSSTFVRRALEDDPRFTVEHRARVAPALTTGTARGALDSAALEETPVVVIGGPDTLTGTDVALLDRFVSQRGGTLILLPERRVTGPAARFFGDGWTERLTPSVEPVGPLRATEILRTAQPPAAAAVLGWSESTASIVAIPRGEGSVIVSGAMDAWRYRDSAFDRFWTSVVSEAALDGMPLTLSVETALAAKGSRVPFRIEHRTQPPDAAAEARARLRCGETTEPLRLWPSGSLGAFVGELPASMLGTCELTASVGDRSTSTSVAVSDRPRRGVTATLAALERSTRDAGGVVVDAGSENDLAAALDDVTAESSRIVSAYPMRVAWWMLPFAACLSVEWWWRRRAGLR